MKFGPDHLIPFPFDPRILLWVAPAVAWAAVSSGVATEMINLEHLPTSPAIIAVSSVLVLVAFVAQLAQRR